MKLSIIGGGNLGGAIAYGAVVAKKILPENIHISHCKAYWKTQFERENYPIICSENNQLAIQNADVILLAVKPWIAKEVFEEIKTIINPDRQIIVSVVAKLSFEMMGEYLGKNMPIPLFSIIPNTAIAVGESTSFICSKNATNEQVNLMVNLFNAMGKTFVIEESQMPSYMSLSSCGIAFALKYIDASMKGGVAMNIDENTALHIVMQTIQGALALLNKNQTLPETEINKVTTPGGITLKGLETMEKNGFTNAVINGLKASQ